MWGGTGVTKKWSNLETQWLKASKTVGRDLKLGFGLGLQLAGPVVPPRIIYQPDRYLIGITVTPTQYPHLVYKLSRLFCINIYSYDVHSLIVIVTVTVMATAISNMS